MTRFYFLHVVLLPLLTALVLWIFLRGATRGDEGRRPWSVVLPRALALLAGAAFLYLGVARSAPLGSMVVPGETDFEARPEWSDGRRC